MGKINRIINENRAMGIDEAPDTTPSGIQHPHINISHPNSPTIETAGLKGLRIRKSIKDESDNSPTDVHCEDDDLSTNLASVLTSLLPGNKVSVGRPVIDSSQSIFLVDSPCIAKFNTEPTEGMREKQILLSKKLGECADKLTHVKIKYASDDNNPTSTTKSGSEMTGGCTLYTVSGPVGGYKPKIIYPVAGTSVKTRSLRTAHIPTLIEEVIELLNK